MSDKNIERQIEMVDYFASLGVNYIWTDLLFPSVDKVPVCETPEKINEFYFDMDKYVDKYIEAFHYAQQKNVFYGSFLTCNFDGKTKYHCRACTPVPHLTPDGYISACDMVTFGEDAHHMNNFIYGKWDSDNSRIVFVEDKIKSLQSRGVDKMLGCENCKVANYYGGYCLGEVLNETGDLFGNKPKTCKAIKKLFESIGARQDKYEYLHP